MVLFSNFSSSNKGGFTGGADWLISVCIGGSRPKDVQCFPVLISTRTIWMNGLCLFSAEEDAKLQTRLSQASLKDTKEKKQRLLSARLTKICVEVDSLYHLPQHRKPRRRGEEKRPPSEGVLTEGCRVIDSRHKARWGRFIQEATSVGK